MIEPAAAIKLPLDAVTIQRLLPHRYPFLLVDRLIEYSQDGERCVAIKNVTINEPFFVGHFPGHPVMPGVLILEAMAQTSALHARLRKGSLEGEEIVYLIAIDKAKFRRPVVPGDQLSLQSTLLRGRGRIWKFRGEALVDGQVVAEAEYMATLPGAGAADEKEPAA
jgi:3-hydroxyacyl-[acyl-carrier-protein] dehydratase